MNIIDYINSTVARSLDFKAVLFFSSVASVVSVFAVFQCIFL